MACLIKSLKVDNRIIGAATIFHTEKSILTLTDIYKYLEINNWKDYLIQTDNPGTIVNIKANTLTGRPLGNDAFVRRLENIFNLRLRPLARGRPRKE